MTVPAKVLSMDSKTTARALPLGALDLDFVFDPTVTGMSVACALVRSGAYEVDLKRPMSEWRTWKSGVRAPVYCDCRTLIAQPEHRAQVGRAFTEAVASLFPDAEVIAGVATAGVPWASIVAQELKLPLVYVRNDPKQHGTGRLVEGPLPRNKRTLIIDDLVASGESVVRVAQRLRQETGAIPIGIQSIVNWGFPHMREVLGTMRYHSLTSYPQILSSALFDGLVDAAGFTSLMHFYKNPLEHSWPLPPTGTEA